MSSRLDPTFVRREIDSLRVHYPWIVEDEEAWLATLESETNLNEFLTAVAKRKAETDKKIEELGNLIADYKMRCDRFEQRSEGLRSLMFRLLQEAGVRKLELAVATLSIRIGQQKVILVDESKLPDEFVRIKREADRVKIKDAIVGGMEVPGATLSNREESLAIRVK